MSPHGRIARYNAGCRCDDCRKANRLRRQRWDLSTQWGAYPTFVDATPVRDHIAALKASGWTYADIGRELGRGPRGIHHIVARSGQRCPHVRRETAAAILALDPLEPVDLDPVVVERLCANPTAWRHGLAATRAERVAAAQRLGGSSWKALGINSAAVKRVEAA